jgi:tRNA (guanine-N7-)-methyltransferase
MSLSLGHGKPLDVGECGIEESQLPPYAAGAIDLRAWFGPRDSDAYQRPLELEIGSGKGTFLVQQAGLTPHINYIGIEWSRPFWRYAADRCRRHGLANVRLLRAEAGFFIRNYVPSESLRQVHIYFPDPWPKARHHKRRLIQAPFLGELHRVLQREGLVRIATDHTDYFAWMGDHAAQVPQLFERLPFESPPSAGEGELVGTNFERKYRREGRPFHGMILRKRT